MAEVYVGVVGEWSCLRVGREHRDLVPPGGEPLQKSLLHYPVTLGVVGQKRQDASALTPS